MQAIVGLAKSWMPSSAASAMASYFLTASLAARMSSNCEMSAPDTKAFSPSPEKTTTRMLSSFSAWPRSAGTASHMSTESALCFAGLLKRMCSTGPSTHAFTRSVGETYVVMSFISVDSFGLEALQRGGIEADLREDLLGMLAAARRGPRDLRRRARHDDRLAHEALLARARRRHLLHHPEVLHLLLLERLLHVVDVAARDA